MDPHLQEDGQLTDEHWREVSKNLDTIAQNFTNVISRDCYHLRCESTRQVLSYELRIEETDVSLRRGVSELFRDLYKQFPQELEQDFLELLQLARAFARKAAEKQLIVQCEFHFKNLGIQKCRNLAEDMNCSESSSVESISASSSDEEAKEQ